MQLFSIEILKYYLIIMYFPQFIFNLMLYEDYEDSFNGLPNGLSSIILVPIFFFTTKSLIIYFNKYRIKHTQLLIKESLLTLFRILISTLFLTQSFIFSLTYGMNFFHSGENLSELPLWISILVLLKHIAIADIFYFYLKNINDIRISNLEKICIVNYIIGLYISITGAFDIFYIAISLIYFLPIKTIKKTIKIKKLLLSILFPILILNVGFFGYANKIGVEEASEKIFSEHQFVDYFLKGLILRASSSYASLIATSNEFTFNPEKQIQAIQYPVNNLLFRICTVLKKEDCTKPNITHIARYNYTITYQDQTPSKAGATPGLIASIFFIPFLPIGFSIITLYTATILFTLNKAIQVKSTSNYRIIHIGIIILFTLAFFISPLDSLVILDPNTILIFIMIFYIKRIPVLKSRITYDHAKL